jgi:uncharacterized membrane protein YidH (DUF202 family)
MTDDNGSDETTEDSQDLAERRTELAEMRNRMAAERTLMGWMRTSISFITFGFSISQFFQYLKQSQPGKVESFTFNEPYILGLVLVGLGTLTLLMASVENYLIVDRLTKKRRIFVSRWSVGSISAAVLIAIGLILFIVLLRSI